MSCAPSSSLACDLNESVVYRGVTCQDDLEVFLESETFEALMRFSHSIAHSIRGLSKTECRNSNSSPPIQATVRMFREIARWIDDIPPLKQRMRFGNQAFRIWHSKLKNEAVKLIEELLLTPTTRESTDDESRTTKILAAYLCDSFGNATRIDYGTGHEAAFLAFLFICRCIGFFEDSSSVNQLIGLDVFTEYLLVTRKLQTVYVLEPAGSKGVWGLDDYHFLPFLWGSSQLCTQDVVKPECVLDATVVRSLAGEYLYMDGIITILDMKKGASFGECAPILRDICAQPNWDKIYVGLFKMYKGEVWAKLPVLQHFQFCSPHLLGPTESPKRKESTSIIPAGGAMGTCTTSKR